MGFLDCFASIIFWFVCAFFLFFSVFKRDYNIYAPHFTLPGYAKKQIHWMYYKLLAENPFQSKEGVSLACLK